MNRLDSNLSILDQSLRSRKRRHLVGGVLISVSLFFGGLAATVLTLRQDVEKEYKNEKRKNI